MAGLETGIMGDRPLVRCWGYGVPPLCAYFGCRDDAPFYFFCRAGGETTGISIEKYFEYYMNININKIGQLP